MSIATIVIYIVAMLVVAVFLNLGGWWATVRLFDRFGQKLKFAPFVAIRHLKGRKSGFLTAIGVLSILGVSFSSCTLTTVLSVMGGFSGDLKDKILRTNAHIVVDNYGTDMEEWDSVIDAVRKVEGVKAATPLLEGIMMMNARTNNNGIVFKGIDLRSFADVSGALNVLEKGELDYLTSPQKLFEKIRNRRKKLYGSVDKSNGGISDAGIENEKESEAAQILPPPVSPRQRVLPALIVGRELSRSLRLYVGGEVNVINPIGGIGPTGPIPKSRPFRIGGVFFSGMFEFDNAYVYTSLKAAQKYLNKEGRISEIHVAVADPEDARTVAESVKKALGGKWRVRSWVELNAPLFSALKLEKIVMFIFLSMAILVASFCIVATLTMLVLEKGAEVSVLMTLGASSGSVQSIFRFEGLLIGIVGTISGLLVGFGLCMFLDKIGLPIDPEVWYIDTLPVNMEWIEFLLVGLASMMTTQLATLYPAHAAARLTPVEGLKNG
ncbi:MAG: ABC transporter permease [Proteobacteria bacterium]|nr:ABC transporter permease [Pseudomonadota bacterium]